jgi:hypothetical protein
LNIRWPVNPRWHRGLLAAAPPALIVHIAATEMRDRMKLNQQLDFTVMSFTQLRVKLTHLAEFISVIPQ